MQTQCELLDMHSAHTHTHIIRKCLSLVYIKFNPLTICLRKRLSFSIQNASHSYTYVCFVLCFLYNMCDAVQPPHWCTCQSPLAITIRTEISQLKLQSNRVKKREKKILLWMKFPFGFVVPFHRSIIASAANCCHIVDYHITFNTILLISNACLFFCSSPPSPPSPPNGLTSAGNFPVFLNIGASEWEQARGTRPFVS